MERIISGTQPTIRTKFFGGYNEAVVPANIFYQIVRADTNQVMSGPNIVTPAQEINVLIPAGAIALTTADRDPVKMLYVLTVTYNTGQQLIEELPFIVYRPAYV